MGHTKQCDYCGKQVVWLTMAYGRKRALFETVSAAFDELPEGNRWAFRRSHNGVVDADNLKHPPALCFRKHWCPGTDPRSGMWMVKRAGALMPGVLHRIAHAKKSKNRIPERGR